MATSRAGATEKEVPLYKHIADLAGKSIYHLPIPTFTLITGGKHAGNNLAIQPTLLHQFKIHFIRKIGNTQNIFLVSEYARFVLILIDAFLFAMFILLKLLLYTYF